ncbi:MAG TPA: hypothetical protein VFA09_04100 [Ktedonobacteraceae bacterium]|nr:hypothetical protein [Ktedonobacteraceae bacterium]
MFERKWEKHTEDKQVGRSARRTRFVILRLLRSPIAWIGLVVITVMLVIALAVQLKAPVPADTFMQSVVERDGSLGWHQLCPTLQVQIPLSVLANQVQEERAAEAREGLSLKVDFVGAHARPDGGEIRVYVITAHRRDGWVGMRTYIVYTQASGCVEDVKNF